MVTSDKIEITFDKIACFDGSGLPYSPIEDKGERLYAVTSDGTIYEIGAEGPVSAYHRDGRYTGIVFDSEGGCFIADSEAKAIICPDRADPSKEPAKVVHDYDGEELLGPHSLLLSKSSSTLFFTDSGKFEDAKFGVAKGSVFAVDLDVNVLKPILYRCLSLPTGMALNGKENILYVSETLENRIIKIVFSPTGECHSSIFYQFAGYFGPTALAMHSKGFLFVARYEMPEMNNVGLISVLNEKGELILEKPIPQAPQITGLWFSKDHPDTLYMTEITHNFLYKLRILFK